MHNSNGQHKMPDPMIAQMANIPPLQQAQVLKLTLRVRLVRISLLEYMVERANHGHAPNSGGERSGTLQK